ncbi:MAG: ribonuclease HII [Pseudomonadota bacterium]
MILGIDEAGRGPVIGPLVLCGVRVSRKRQNELAALGVRDSKTFGSGSKARQLRSELAERIKSISSVTIRIAPAKEVDLWVQKNGLNRLEQKLALEIIEQGPRVSKAIADGARLFGPLQSQCKFLEALNKADKTHPVVAAASIVAKAKRDSLLAEIFLPLESEFGPIRGGGYPNQSTAKFIRAFFQRYGILPPETRKTWSWAVLKEFTNNGPVK